MVADYNPNLGIFGFQEYQGSLREENIDGEPRYFRTFTGPSENRHQFLRHMFGSWYIDTNESPDCLQKCGDILLYPQAAWKCTEFDPNISPDFAMAPVSYRIEPQDSQRSHSIGTALTVNSGQDSELPQIACNVNIEIEYRKALRQWPAFIHDPTFESPMHTTVREKFDVPQIHDPTWIEIVDNEYAVERRTIEGRNFEVCSFGSIVPQTVAGAAVNDLPIDSVTPFTTIHTHIFTIRMFNVPYWNVALTHAIRGYLNDEVWFGYPADAVYCAEVNPVLKCSISNNFIYDVDFKFIARWVPSTGEFNGQLMPGTSATVGSFVYGGKVGVWNRVWWEHPLAGKQHWWPYTLKGRSTPSTFETWPAEEHNQIKQTNFHNGFYWWEDICGA